MVRIQVVRLYDFDQGSSTNPIKPSNEGNCSLKSSILWLLVRSILWVNASFTHDATKTASSLSALLAQYHSEASNLDMLSCFKNKRNESNICWGDGYMVTSLHFEVHP